LGENDMIKLKRIYEEPAKSDGYRILVDRLWPRGMSKDKAGVDLWLKDVAPSDNLRRWYSHDPQKWGGFKAEYREELKEKMNLLDCIRKIEKEKGMVTLLFSSREQKYNNAVALKEILHQRAGEGQK
jgi:uncharacterized protein YeaO (DUF488 family)